MDVTKKKVLIIEDEIDARILFYDILTGAGIEATAVGSVTEALAAIEKTHFDLLLLDIVTPDINGLKMLEILGKYPAKYSCGKIVMLTNSTGTEKVQVALDLGASGYMVKSETEPGDLIMIVNKYLEIV